jgi:hypothetical protein
VSAATGRGVDELRGVLRERLVPRALVENAGAWRFW